MALSRPWHKDSARHHSLVHAGRPALPLHAHRPKRHGRRHPGEGGKRQGAKAVRVFGTERHHGTGRPAQREEERCGIPVPGRC